MDERLLHALHVQALRRAERRPEHLPHVPTCAPSCPAGVELATTPAAAAALAAEREP
jgi:hypothetical protein